MKYLIAGALVCVVYCLWIRIGKPFATYIRYKRSGLVSAPWTFIPLVEGAWEAKRDFINKGLTAFHFYKKISQEDRAMPYRLFMSHGTPILIVNDVQKMREFQDRIPTTVDRDGKMDSGASPAKLFGEYSLVDLRSNSSTNFKTRRESFVKVIGINYASKFIPTIIKEFK
jgi:hypothetical protein